MLPWILLLGCLLCPFAATERPILDPVHDLHNYQVVHPNLVPSAARFGAQALQSDPSHPTRLFSDAAVPQHVEHATFRLNAYGKDLTLDLDLDRDFLSPTLTEAWIGEDGKMEGASSDRELCYYKGRVRGDPDSVVSASTCNGLDAMIWSQGQHYVINPATKHPTVMSVLKDQQSRVETMSADGPNIGPHIVFTREDLKDPPRGKCGVTEAYDLIRPAPELQFEGQGNVQAPETRLLAQPTRALEFMLVNDYSVFQRYGRSREAVRDYNIKLASAVNSIYDQLGLGITVTLVAIVTFTGTEPSSLRTSASESMDTYLNRFSSWRRTYNGRFDAQWQPCSGGEGCFDLRNDNAHLLTATDRSGGVVGLGWVGSVCSESTSSAVNEDNTQGAWQFTVETIAHELGHNFGSNHDSTGNNCSPSQYLMAAVGCSNCPFVGYKTWSSCSKTSITQYLNQLERDRSNCLTNLPRAGVDQEIAPTPAPSPTAVPTPAPIPTATPRPTGLPTPTRTPRPTRFPIPSGIPIPTGIPFPIPTNIPIPTGIPLPPFPTISPAPSPSPTPTVMPPAPPGLACNQGECCDELGWIKPAGTVCRRAKSLCDLEEYCDGFTVKCSDDLWLADGTSCGSSESKSSQCFEGACVDRDEQCQRAFAKFPGKWVHGGQGDQQGSCGLQCGQLRCTNTLWPNYCFSQACDAGKTCTIGGVEFTGPRIVSVCRCASPPRKPAFVTDGSTCSLREDETEPLVLAQAGMGACVQHQCQPFPEPAVPAGSVRCVGRVSCHNHGVCNNLGGCSCDEGYYGALCDRKYQCSEDCSSLNRRPCGQRGECGPCQFGYATENNEPLSSTTRCVSLARTVVGAPVKSGGRSPNDFDVKLVTQVSSPIYRTAPYAAIEAESAGKYVSKWPAWAWAFLGATAMGLSLLSSFAVLSWWRSRGVHMPKRLSDLSSHEKTSPRPSPVHPSREVTTSASSARQPASEAEPLSPLHSVSVESMPSSRRRSMASHPSS